MTKRICTMKSSFLKSGNLCSAFSGKTQATQENQKNINYNSCLWCRIVSNQLLLRATKSSRRFLQPLLRRSWLGIPKNYVDNYLDCTDIEEEAIARLRDVSALLKCDGFNMVRWVSSSRSFQATVDPSDLSRSLDLDTEKNLNHSTLNLRSKSKPKANLRCSKK